MNEAADASAPAGGRRDVELIEVVTEEIDSEGNLIVDDSVFVVDDEGSVIARDEAVTFETPAGDVMESELGDDGQMHLVDEDAT